MLRFWKERSKRETNMPLFLVPAGTRACAPRATVRAELLGWKKCGSDLE